MSLWIQGVRCPFPWASLRCVWRASLVSPEFVAAGRARCATAAVLDRAERELPDRDVALEGLAYTAFEHDRAGEQSVGRALRSDQSVRGCSTTEAAATSAHSRILRSDHRPQNVRKNASAATLRSPSPSNSSEHKQNGVPRAQCFRGFRPCSLAFADLRKIGETGFEPATARPPAGGMGYRSVDGARVCWGVGL